MAENGYDSYVCHKEEEKGLVVLKWRGLADSDTELAKALYFQAVQEDDATVHSSNANLCWCEFDFDNPCYDG